MRWEQEMLCRCVVRKKMQGGQNRGLWEGGGRREGAQVSQADRIPAALQTLHLLGDLGQVA